jgi:hypothetical protein
VIRFQPDTWFDGALRPLLLGDPSAGLYYEEGAPDWRFAALVALTLAALLTRQGRHLLNPARRVALLALALLFYLWTFSTGNGRYFMTGLLLTGPLLVMVWQTLPGSRTFRWLLLLGFTGLQVFTVAAMLRPGAWGLVRWQEGAAVALQDSPLRHRPLTIVTISSISYAILVPQFDPDSRWINLTGQVPVRPQLPEYKRARALLAAPLPIYLLVPGDAGRSLSELPIAPDSATWDLIDESLNVHGLTSPTRHCEAIRTNLLPHGYADSNKPAPVGFFWLCALVLAAPSDQISIRFNDPYADVFDKVEANCPRYFTPGAAATREYTGFWQRYYLGSDMRLMVDTSGQVLYRYYRHFSPVRIATVPEVRERNWSLNCVGLAGRYRPPWRDAP